MSSARTCLCDRDLFQTDNYTPVTVQNEGEYEQMMKRFPYQDLKLHQVAVDESSVMLACSSVSVV